MIALNGLHVHYPNNEDKDRRIFFDPKKIKEIVEEVKSELDHQGILYGNVEQGIMIETPAAVMIGDELAENKSAEFKKAVISVLKAVNCEKSNRLTVEFVYSPVTPPKISVLLLLLFGDIAQSKSFVHILQKKNRSADCRPVRTSEIYCRKLPLLISAHGEIALTEFLFCRA